MIDAVTYEKAFLLFVDNDSVVIPVRSIIKHNGFYLATDCHSLIFMPVEKAPLLNAETMPVTWQNVIPIIKNCNIIINIADFEKQLVPDMIDEIIEEETENKCKECDGKGEIECDMGHKHDCEKCHGDGNIIKTSRRATGNKIVNDEKVFRLNGVVFTYKQLRRLVDACKLLQVETIMQTFTIKNNGNLFECGDASILIMPVVRDPETDDIPIISL